MRILAIAAAVLIAGTADARTVVVNANGYTLDDLGRLTQFTGLVIGDDGRVERTLKDGEAAPEGDVVDAGGKTLLPGLIDAHGHVMGLGFQALQLDLTETKSLDEALAKIAEYAKANPDLPWILGRGWNQVSWKLGRFPTAAELDAVVPDRPVWLERVDGHAGWANSAALKAGGVTAATKDPQGGRIERDADGNPAGVLVDGATVLVGDKVPPPTDAQAEAALEKALEIMASVGLTGVHDAGIDPKTWALYRQFGEEGRLTARVYAMAGGIDALNQIAPNGPTGWLFDDHLALDAMKLYADGALGSRGAAMIEPYTDDPHNHGLLFVDGAKLRNMIASASSRGFQVNIHAIGDRANREVLDAFEDVAKMGLPGVRNRIEHAQVLSPDDIPRLAKLGVIASMQPTHATSDKAMAEDRIGTGRIKGAYAWKTLIESGARFAGGSDFPVESPNPFYGIHAGVTRQDHDDQPPGGWYPNEALSLPQAFAAFTTGAAYAGQEERQVGTLTPGKWADFIIVDRDIFKVSPEQIWETVVEQTWVGGKKVFERE
jgi:predicted amidohydrolase YtcJ